MKIERTKNAVRNIIFGVLEKVFSFLFPFISRTVFIYYLGIEYLGLNSLFTSVLGVLSLAELGVDNAMVFHMYRAIADDDTKVMCALLNFYKKCYRIIGIVILTIGTAIMPFLHLLIKDEVPTDINLYVVYYINLLATVSTYVLFAYKSSLLAAFQRSDILSKINSVLSIIQCVLQIGVLVFFQNYYFYAIIMVIINIIRNFVIAKKANKDYPNYVPKGKVEKQLLEDIKTKISALFAYRVGYVAATSVDTMVISAFLGLSVLGVYNNYLYVITALTGFLQIYNSSLLAGIGNSVSIETIEKNYKDYSKLTFIQAWIIGWSSICLLCLYQPFMKLWMGAENMLPFEVVMGLAIYFFSWKIQDVIYIYIQAAGLWQHDKYASIIGAVFNLCVNILLVNLVGVYGIVISTILTNVFIIMPWRVRGVYKFYFNKSTLSYYKNILKYSMITIFSAVLTYSLCILIRGEDIVILLVRAVICLFIPNLLFWMIYKNDTIFLETREFLLQKLKVVKE